VHIIVPNLLVFTIMFSSIMMKSISNITLFFGYSLMEHIKITKVCFVTSTNKFRICLFCLNIVGNFADFKRFLEENRDSLPQLDNAQLNKLKQLSIVSLSETTRVSIYNFRSDSRILFVLLVCIELYCMSLMQTIPYSRLLEYLDVPNVRELEDLIIEAIYQGLIKGKLDQKKKQLGVEYTMGRDLRPGQIDQMLKVLADWCVQMI